jgi:hypothetical protein
VVDLLSLLDVHAVRTSGTARARASSFLLVRTVVVLSLVRPDARGDGD